MIGCYADVLIEATGVPGLFCSVSAEGDRYRS